MAVYDDLKAILLGAGLTDVKNGQLPMSPDDVIVIRSTGGLDALRTHSIGVRYSRPRVQIIVRATTSALAEARAQTALNALIKQNVVINGTRYLSIEPIDDLTDMGKDGQKPARHEFSFNVQVIRGS